MSNTADREIVLSRVLNAPRELVWEVWTNPEHIIHWWGPDGFTNTIHEMDVKQGGEWHFTMHGPDGTDYPNKIVFKKVIENELLSYTHGNDGADEKDLRSFEVEVTFKDLRGKTELVMRSIFPTAEAREFVVRKFGALEGGKQTLNHLAAYLAGMID